MQRWYVNTRPTQHTVNQITEICASECVVMRLVMWEPQRNWCEAWEILLRDRLEITAQQRLLVELILADCVCEVNSTCTRTVEEDYQLHSINNLNTQGIDT